VLDNRIGECRFSGFQCGMRDVHRRGSGVYLRVDLAAIHDGHRLARTDTIANLDGATRQCARQLRENGDTRLRHEIAGDLKRRFEVRRADGQRWNIDTMLGDRGCAGGGGRLSAVAA